MDVYFKLRNECDWRHIRTDDCFVTFDDLRNIIIEKCTASKHTTIQVTHENGDKIEKPNYYVQNKSRFIVQRRPRQRRIKRNERVKPTQIHGIPANWNFPMAKRGRN